MPCVAFPCRLGPFPKAKLAKLVVDVRAAIDLVAEGK
jgi:hypothetical protein